MELQLIVREGFAELGLQFLARVRDFAHRDVENAVIVAASRFGPVERKVGLLQQVVGIDAMIRSEGDADADADLHLVSDDLVGLGDRHDDLVGEVDRAILLIRFPGLNNGELVAAQPRKNIGFAQDRLQTPRRLVEHDIAGRMPQRIVDVLESVQIHHENGERLAPSPMARACFFDLRQER